MEEGLYKVCYLNISLVGSVPLNDYNVSHLLNNKIHTAPICTQPSYSVCTHVCFQYFCVKAIKARNHIEKPVYCQNKEKVNGDA